jgi:hypothetical protein
MVFVSEDRHGNDTSATVYFRKYFPSGHRGGHFCAVMKHVGLSARFEDVPFSQAHSRYQ